MKSFTNQIRRFSSFALTATAMCFGLGTIQAQAQSVIYTFSDGTSDGWADGGFGSTPQASVVTIGGENYISVPMSGGFQSANVGSASQLGGGTYDEDPYNTLTPAFNNAMYAALNNPAGYDLTYDYSINTATFTTSGTYLQIGSFVNPESSYYAQDFPEVQLTGAQVASGDVISGQVVVPFTAFGTDTNAATEVGFRLGFILNGDGTGVTVDFSNIEVAPVPEPATLSVCCLGLATGFMVLRRRRASESCY